MQKRSHALLASALLRVRGGFPARRYELAFLFGSIQPDCNPFSYLKGSLHNKLFGGHTYGNARPYIDRRIRRLRERDRWRLWHYYTLGKLTHYVADAFTYPHNPHFPGKGWEHHVYETALRLRLAEVLSEKALPDHTHCQDLSEELARLHRRYLSAPSDVDRDIRYIALANVWLMNECRAPAASREAVRTSLTPSPAASSPVLPAMVPLSPVRGRAAKRFGQ